MSYMTQLLELQSLGAPEKLEVAARLLLAVREQLEAHVVDVCVANPSRYVLQLCMFDSPPTKITRLVP